MVARLIEREYYPLKIAAGMIGCTVDDLICLGGTGKIKILAKAFGLKAMKFDSNGNPVTKEIETISDDYCLVHPDSIKHYETGRSIGRDDYEISDYLDSLLMPDKSGGFWNLAMRDDFIKMTDESLFVPNACIKQLKAQSETQVMGTEARRQSGKRQTRKTNLVRAIESAIKNIGHKPSIEELWQYFDDSRDETGFVIDMTESKIIWRDTKGAYKETTKKTVNNKLSSLKP